MLSFIVTGDLHLDHPFAALSGDEEEGNRLTKTTFDAWNRVVEHCCREAVDFLLVTGDVYDTANRSLRAQIAFRDGLARLWEKGIASYVVHGNHDPLHDWSSALEWPDGCHIFSSRTVEPVLHRRKGSAVAALHGISYPQKAVHENLALRFSPLPDFHGPQIALLHCNAGHQTEHEPYAPCTLKNLEAAGFDFWALGHVHTRRILQQTPAILYPGSPQGLHRNERGEHSCTLVRMDGPGTPEMTPLATSALRWEALSLDITNAGTVDAVLGMLETESAFLLSKIPCPVRLRLTLTGRTSLHRELSDPSNRNSLIESIEAVLAALPKDCRLDRLRISTAPAVDLATLRAGQNFLGDCLRELQTLREDPERMKQLLQALPLYQSRALRDAFSLPQGPALEELLAEAESLCLDTLLEEEEA